MKLKSEIIEVQSNMALLKQRMLTRNWKKKVLQDESQFNCMTSEVKEQILKLCKSPKKRKLKLEESPLQKFHVEDKDRVENIEWIMCDDCQKWRKISCEDAKEFHGSKKWFCSLNKNLAFNQCFVPEECYSNFIKITRQKDLHVVILGLQLGDLVWGKMETFYKWPALITCDPICGQFVYSELGYEVQYHVEFLGAKHSHAWIKGYCIELYSETVFKNDLSSTKKSKKKKSQISRNLKQYNHLQNAIKEANALVAVTNSRRMECCVFENADGKALLAESQRKFIEYTEFPINRSANKACHKNDSTIVQICSKPNRCCIQQNSPSKTQNSNEQTEPFLMSCYNNTESNNSLLTLTPQQRLSFDIEVYKKSEVAFTVDLKQFLARNNLHLENTYWENVPVNSYQLFQTVNEFGGYEMVTQKAKWSNIYREITNTHEKYKGKLVRKFYYRNLYAYTLYILGKDYEHIIQDILKQEKKDKSFILEKIQKKPKIVQHKPDDDIFCSLYQKFEELEKANRMCYFEEEIKSAQKELGIYIRFHDEPAPVCPLLEYELPLIDSAFSDDSQAQIAEGFQVPDIFAFDSHLDKYWTPNSSNHSKTDPDNASINLEDLHDLRDQIELISYEINQ